MCQHKKCKKKRICHIENNKSTCKKLKEEVEEDKKKKQQQKETHQLISIKRSIARENIL